MLALVLPQMQGIEWAWLLVAALALSDLVRPLTADEVKASILTIAIKLKLNTSSWKEGGITRTILAIVAELHAGMTEVLAPIIAGGLLDYAEDDWLTLLAKNVYNVDRILATRATGKVKLTNAGASTHNIEPGALVVQNSTTKKTYVSVNTATVVLAPSATVEIDVLAEEAGTASDSLATEIDTLVTTLLGVTVTNDNALLGADKEEDEDLRERCRDSLGALSPNGPKAAYTFVVKSAKRADGSAVGANRVRVTSSSGNVTVIFATPTGAPTGSDVTVVDDEVQELAVPIGITATTQGAVDEVIGVTYTAYVPADTPETDQEIIDAVEEALKDYFRTLPIGGLEKITGSGFVWHDLLRGRIADASAQIFTVDLTAPAADVAIATTEVPKLGTITPTITRVAQAA